MREGGLHHRHAPHPWESGHGGQRVLNSNTDEKDPTLATANIITIKKWDVDITAEYIIVSLAITPRMFDAFVPWYVDANSCVRTRTNTKPRYLRERTGG